VRRGPTLRCLQLQLERPSGSLRRGIEAALALHGRPLRWAITGVSGSRLAIEAVVIEDVVIEDVGIGHQPR
jgi:hypothetical protein